MKKFLSPVLIIFLLFSIVMPIKAASGDDVEYVQKPDFWTWIAGSGSILHEFVGHTMGKVCPNAEDGYHHSSTYESMGTLWKDGYFICRCIDCGKEFTAYASDLQQSYDNQVEELPAPNYGSNGELRWRINVIAFDKNNDTDLWSSLGGTSYRVTFSQKGSYSACVICYCDGFVAPLDGTYTLYAYFQPFVSNTIKLAWVNGTGTFMSPDNTFLPIGISSQVPANVGLYKYGSGNYFSGATLIPNGSCFPLTLNLGNTTVYSVQGYWEFACIPITTLGDTYNINTRPTGITGNYGIIGDNGQITQITDNSSIVNETTNQFFNPATGENTTISDWSYNYEDRSYTVTTETGDTVTVTYGDENITIVQGGDTYNIYYMVPGSGSDSPGPDACAHNWQETDKTEPTCVTAGKTISTCALCGKTKTDPIPAAGHTWVVDCTVQTVYDDDGNLLQQGYTIYQCSVCGEQYKDTQSTGPPGSEEDKSLWEQLGDLIGSGIGGILELVEAVLGKILDALTSLVEMITDKLKGIVEGILAIFDELPTLFGGFLDFLGALFPYLPEEIMLLLTFGIAAVVFIGILKAVRR